MRLITKRMNNLNNLNNYPILFDKYQVIRELGSGSFSPVLLVRHISMELERACKVIPKTQVGSVSDISEVKLLKSINHPGIPRIYDIEEDDKNFYLIEEYVQGESIDEFLLHNPIISNRQFHNFCMQLCDIFNYLHSFSPAPILYKDLKPEHIILCGFQLKLIDFGISSYVTSSGNNFNKMGNIDFSAPESFTDDNITLQADIYSIGKIIELLSTHLEQKIPRKLIEIIQKSTASDTSSRYETVGELSSALKKIFEKDNQPKLRKSIAVVGANSGCGATHFAISLVSALNSMGYSSIYFEKNSSNTLQNAAKFEKSLVEQNGFYTCKSFCGLPNYGPGIKTYIPKSDINVYDLGADDDNILSFLNSDTNMEIEQFILVCNGSLWHYMDAIRKLKILQDAGVSIVIVSNLCDKAHSIALARQLNEAVYYFPFDNNPFKLNSGKEKFYTQLFSKKGWFKSYSGKRNLKFKFPKLQ